MLHIMKAQFLLGIYFISQLMSIVTGTLHIERFDLCKELHYNKTVSYNKKSECQVADYLRSAGFPSSAIPTMVCISKYESSYNCDATNKNTDGSTDYGLFQINSYYWCSGDSNSKYNECGASCTSLFDCQKNANCADRVYREQGFNAWYGYQYHKSECDSYQIDC
jgi:lysozyme C